MKHSKTVKEKERYRFCLERYIKQVEKSIWVAHDFGNDIERVTHIQPKLV